jgi:hypothetical protein
MLNIFSNAESAAGPRAGFALGAFLPWTVGTVRPDGTGAIVRPRPASTATASTAQPFGRQNRCEKYAHMTHIVTGGGDALGPHPARDPV